MTTTTGRRSVLGSALRRFGVIGVLVGVIGGFAASQIAENISSPSYVAEGTFLVPLAPPVAPTPLNLPQPVPDVRPASSYEAQRIAANDAELLVEDPALLQALSDRLGISVKDVIADTAAVNLPSTAVVRVTFTDDSRATAAGYFSAMREILTAPQSVTANIPATTLVPLRYPDEVTKQAGLTPIAPWLGVVAGLLLGLAAAVLLERLLTLVRTPGDVHALTDWPVLSFGSRVSPERAETVVLRVLESVPDARQVAVVAPKGSPVEARTQLIGELQQAEARLRAAGRLPAPAAPITWVTAGVVPDDGVAERRVQDSGAVVLVLHRKARLKQVAGAVERLQDLSTPPVIVALGVPTGRRRLPTPALPKAAPSKAGGANSAPSGPGARKPGARQPGARTTGAGQGGAPKDQTGAPDSGAPAPAADVDPAAAPVDAGMGTPGT